MRILINPNFLKSLEIIKNKARPHEVAEIEKMLASIESDPSEAERLGKTNIYKKNLITNYFIYIVVYEYNEDKNEIIFWSIE